MLSKSEKHNTNVDFAALLQHEDQHAIATQEHAEPVKSSYAPAKRLKKKPDISHAVVSPQKQDGSSCTQVAATPPVVHKSLWDSYNELYSIQFGNGDYFPVAQRTKLQPDEHSLCIVKRFSGVNVEERIHAFQRIKHQQFVQAQKLFSQQNDLFVAFEFMPVSLAEVEGNPLLDDLQLASILGQIVNVLLYLEKNSLGHGQLIPSNILIDIHGNVKLWGQEFIHNGFNLKETLRSLAVITMRLIQGYAKEGDRIGLDMPGRCPLGFDFLSALEQMTSIEDLYKHPLLQQHWNKERLVGLVSLVIIWCDRGFKVPPRR
ncbi:hypothetical protein NQ176_g2290 [Zarea fungicola]|uniref:Uncharacterized protein n=1 Tax=Zarea fungicola TaxID=93591 RepID=A0ACC1NNU9_9HYPO|nr:hypothetical protein NQ176_g2290 [Lecanicillium fungicola]